MTNERVVLCVCVCMFVFISEQRRSVQSFVSEGRALITTNETITRLWKHCVPSTLHHSLCFFPTDSRAENRFSRVSLLKLNVSLQAYSYKNETQSQMEKVTIRRRVSAIFSAQVKTHCGIRNGGVSHLDASLHPVSNFYLFLLIFWIFSFNTTKPVGSHQQAHNTFSSAVCLLTTSKNSNLTAV